MADLHLTADEFGREYNRGASRADFLEFMEKRIDERYWRGQITQNTHKFAGDFDAWLKKAHDSCLNARSRCHRNVKTYLELAQHDKITFKDSCQHFVNSVVQGQ